MLRTINLTKTYVKAGRTVSAARDLDLSFRPGVFAVVHGPSGSGKSTLLLMLGGMLSPSSGSVVYGQEDIYRRSPAWRSRFRQACVGFVFQRFFLLPYLTVFDNIRMPLALGRKKAPAQPVIALAERLGLTGRLRHKPHELSMGEQQRTAVARALVHEPGMVLADEPTGNLDLCNSRIIADCFKEEAAKGRLVVMVTHQPALLDAGTRQYRLENGALV